MVHCRFVTVKHHSHIVGASGETSQSRIRNGRIQNTIQVDARIRRSGIDLKVTSLMNEVKENLRRCIVGDRYRIVDASVVVSQYNRHIIGTNPFVREDGIGCLVRIDAVQRDICPHRGGVHLDRASHFCKRSDGVPSRETLKFCIDILLCCVHAVRAGDFFPGTVGFSVPQGEGRFIEPCHIGICVADIQMRRAQCSDIHKVADVRISCGVGQGGAGDTGDLHTAGEGEWDRSSLRLPHREVREADTGALCAYRKVVPDPGIRTDIRENNNIGRGKITAAAINWSSVVRIGSIGDPCVPWIGEVVGTSNRGSITSIDGIGDFSIRGIPPVTSTTVNARTVIHIGGSHDLGKGRRHEITATPVFCGVAGECAAGDPWTEAKCEVAPGTLICGVIDEVRILQQDDMHKLCIQAAAKVICAVHHISGKGAVLYGEFFKRVSTGPEGLYTGTVSITRQTVAGDVEALHRDVVCGDGDGRSGVWGIGQKRTDRRTCPRFYRHIRHSDGDATLIGVTICSPDLDGVAIFQERDVFDLGIISIAGNGWNIPENRWNQRE